MPANKVSLKCYILFPNRARDMISHKLKKKKTINVYKFLKIDFLESEDGILSSPQSRTTAKQIVDNSYKISLQTPYNVDSLNISMY